MEERTVNKLNTKDNNDNLKGVEMKKRLIIILSTVTVVALSIILLIPGVLPGASDGTVSVTRMYGETIEGPWSNTSSETTKYVLEISTSNGQTTV